MLGRSPKSISGQNNLITQRNTKKNNRQDNPADCFFLCAVATICKPWLYFQNHNSPLARLEQKSSKKQNGVWTLSKRRFIFQNAALVERNGGLFCLSFAIDKAENSSLNFAMKHKSSIFAK